MNKGVSKKRGQLSTTEMQFIKDSATSMSPEEIAVELNRNVDPVKRYMAEERLFSANQLTEEAEIVGLRKKLKSRIYWPEVVKQLSNDADEPDYFESTWINMMRQFKEDVTATEELQIKQYIIIDILLNRSQKDIARYVNERDKAENELDELYKADVALRDTARISSLESQIVQLGNAIGSNNNAYIKLVEKSQQISKDLKATRDQRFDKIEKAGLSWSGLIRALDDADVRAQEGREMELARLAGEKSKKDLAEYHTYLDGKIDTPFLNFETVQDKDE